jgi:hypothetical protein
MIAVVVVVVITLGAIRGLIRSFASLTQREISGFPVERVGGNAAAHVYICVEPSDKFRHSFEASRFCFVETQKDRPSIGHIGIVFMPASHK